MRELSFPPRRASAAQPPRSRTRPPTHARGRGAPGDLGIEDLDGGEGCDAIISTLVLEHLPFDRYQAANAKCFWLLKPAGWLLAAEGYAEEGRDIWEWFFQEMESRRKAVDPELSDFVARLRDEKEKHHYCSKAGKEGWWRQAGFVQVKVLWQCLCIALMAGRKSMSIKNSRHLVKPAAP